MSEKTRLIRAQAASREVLTTAAKAERLLVRQLLKRLEQLRTELLAVLARRGTTPFRFGTASSLLAEVDSLIAAAEADLLQLAQQAYRAGADTGTAVVTQALRAAQIQVGSALGIDRRLVTTAFENTVDLLSETMQQFRNKAALLVRRVATEGESTFGAMQALAKQIDGKGFDSAMFRAERIVRTELSRTFNASSYQRMVELSRDMPFLRKTWVSARDSRVRESHQQAHDTYGRGHGIPIDEPFVVGGAKLRYPSDPHGPPAQTIMCRCHNATDFDLKDLRAFTVQRLSVVVPGAAA